MTSANHSRYGMINTALFIATLTLDGMRLSKTFLFEKLSRKQANVQQTFKLRGTSLTINIIRSRNKEIGVPSGLVTRCRCLLQQISGFAFEGKPVLADYEWTTRPSISKDSFSLVPDNVLKLIMDITK